MITVPWEKRIICIGVSANNKDRLIADMERYVQDRPYSESNYRRFIAALRDYGHYSCCLNFDTMSVDGDGFAGEWISTGGLMDDPMFKLNFARYANRGKVSFFARQPNTYCMLLNMVGQLLYTSDDISFNPKPAGEDIATQMFELVKERLLRAVDYIELDDLCL